MKMCFVCMFTILLVFSCSCQKNSKEQLGQLQSGCIRTKLSVNDSTGVLIGNISMWDKPNALVTYGGLWVVDKDNETIIFRVEPNQTKNFKCDNLEIGQCIKVTYSREIVEEDGIELNRFYYATRLDYP